MVRPYHSAPVDRMVPCLISPSCWGSPISRHAEKEAGAHLPVDDVIWVVVAPGRLPVPGVALPPVRHSRGAGPAQVVVHGPHNSRGEPWMETAASD
ncbi:hypothetical protein AVEN_98443-1 [Araneus ventricosus]|uniref:Uncharacterized protein n=1 Tax=Araneus ventricosus TaxID=182803 RepID=A0A4Y2RB88_ARAVE|nr:hypothetical protein AVEN_186058-1 [Araneus ventricosus]GBN73062.1 hypothetical protein AVEN_219594-1 [Araneus ventricosus]GBN73201.1 hypothetical protein AVEN_233968-1 [Araneus ventricosus]GBN73337.1 hypothetical protein AVEN_98443-1 [Araneus ventricosus]